MTTESDVWQKVRAAWTEGPAWRIEASAGGVDPGTPDTLLWVRGAGGRWVELKVWPTAISAIQIAWHVDCLQRGGMVWVLCEVGRGRYWIGSAEEYARIETRPCGVSLQAALGVVVSGGTKHKSDALKPIEEKYLVAPQASIKASRIQKRRLGQSSRDEERDEASPDDR